MAVGSYFGAQLSNQESRNGYIRAENARLDLQIKEIAALKQEIDGLKACQQAVEDLQSDRNQPVYLLVELVKQVPEGIYLRSLKQTGQRVVLNGTAHSNERVSELLRNIGNSSWLERPELVEIRATSVGGRDARKAFEFTINVGIRRARDKEATRALPVSAAINAVAPGAPTSGTPQPAAKPAAPKS
jgi:type IV pilus assembly protein PilN